MTPWTVAHQAPLSMEFSRQGYWSGLPWPSPGDLPDPGIKPGSPKLQQILLPFEPPGKLSLSIYIERYICMCICTVALGACCCAGSPLDMLLGLLIAVASLAAARGLQVLELWSL